MTKEVDRLSDHPAFKAWRAVDPYAEIPKGIDVLKYHSKSKVFRLWGIGPDNLTIVAKGSKFKHLRTEQVIYRKILPDCGFSSIKYYGFVKNKGDELSWLFVEDARGEEYDPTNKHHRMAAMQWLWILHGSFLSEGKISLLPDKSLKCYYDYLQKAHANILRNINNPHLTTDHVRVLKDIVSKLEKIASKWDHIELSCAAIPLSFIHGDFKNLNVKVRRIKSDFALIPFDWASGGWGNPAVDLGSLVYDSSKASEEELKMYTSKMGPFWGGVGFQDIRHLVHVGRILMLIYIIYAEKDSLNYKWVWKPMGRMGYYQESISDVFKTIAW